MKILVTGSTGLVGSALLPLLSKRGEQVFRLVRTSSPANKNEISWDPESQKMDLKALEGMEAVVHLAGENIASGRWTEEKKTKIRKSRVQGTSFLAGALAQLSMPPKVFVTASAVGYYGNRASEILNERSSSGEGFLAEVCREWEEAALPATQKGIRVVHLRFGMILTPSGGALAKMLPPFKMGAGGYLGKGTQYMSWVSIDDVVHIVAHVIKKETLQGPVNVVSPHPVTNKDFTKILGRVLSRPTLFPMPEAVIKLAFGEMAKELLLASTRVEPAALAASGYSFQHPDLELALRSLLGK